MNHSYILLYDAPCFTINSSQKGTIFELTSSGGNKLKIHGVGAGNVSIRQVVKDAWNGRVKPLQAEQMAEIVAKHNIKVIYRTEKSLTK